MKSIRDMPVFIGWCYLFASLFFAFRGYLLEDMDMIWMALVWTCGASSVLLTSEKNKRSQGNL